LRIEFYKQLSENSNYIARKQATCTNVSDPHLTTMADESKFLSTDPT